MPSRTPTVLLLYAHADRRHRRALETHLQPAVDAGKIGLWFDERVACGDRWEEQLIWHLEHDPVIVPLVSADFLASAYVRGVELPRLLQRWRGGDAMVIPVALRPVLLTGHPLEAILGPLGQRTLVEHACRDRAWVKVAGAIGAAASTSAHRRQ